MESTSNSGTTKQVLSSHILSASVVMIGVSTTLIGLVKVAKGHMGATRADHYAAVTALLFLFSALTSYLSIRWVDNQKLREQFDHISDVIFICALIGISAISIFFAYEAI